MQGSFFPPVCKGREGRFKPMGSERGIPERQPELWMGLGGVFVQVTKGTLSEQLQRPAGKVFTLLAFPHIYHSLLVFLTDTQSYAKNKSILNLQKAGSHSKKHFHLEQAGFPSVQQKFPCKSTSLHSFKLFFFTLFGEKS